MNAGQERAIAVLDRLTTEKPRRARAKEFVASDAVAPPSALRPGEWPGAWCEGWAFRPVPGLVARLDIAVTLRRDPIMEPDPHRPGKMRRKYIPDPENPEKKRAAFRLVNEWTQGSAFCFAEGEIIWDAPEPQPGVLWKEQSASMRCGVYVVDGEPAAPPVGGESPQPRDPGRVKFRLMRGEHGWKQEDVELETTQDDFVRFLITGELPPPLPKQEEPEAADE